MSDHIRDLVKRFERNVERKPVTFGLYPIPEHSDLNGGRGMWSSAVGILLTTLRYLAPATLLTLFWGQQSFLYRFLKSIDTAFRTIVFSNEDQKEEILQWLENAGGVRVERLETVWRHGWVLCGVLDAAMPGACGGHPPARLSLKHAEEIASSYLGVEPVFTDEELESNDLLSKEQEWKLVTYLNRIRQALGKLSPPVSKPTSQRTSPEIMQVTFDYVARGSGLAVAQVNNKTFFKVYPTSQQSLNPGEITILIRGPKDTYGMTIIPPILGKAQLIRQKLLGLQTKPIYTENALPITQGAAYLRSYGKNDMNKTYHIPKIRYDIDIEVEQQIDQAKVGYIVNLEGKYDISITTRGQNIVGSPFSMTAAKNVIGILEKESFSLEDGEEVGIVDVKSDRKVVLRIVDFVTEKMLLKEDGAFEKITDEEAKILMSTDIRSNFSDFDSRTCNVQSDSSDDFEVKSYKFNKAAHKVVQMNRVCKIINSILTEKRKHEKAFIRQKSQQSIPDIVNSTFSETNVNPFTSENRDKYLVPQNIAVSLKTEKATLLEGSEKKTAIIASGKTALNFSAEYSSPDSLDMYESIHEETESDDMIKGSSNPFLNVICEQNYAVEKDLGTFVKTEYETNKSQNEETEGPPIKILIENFATPTPSPSPTNTNPFVEPDIITLERPKTPILKIITGDIQNRGDSIYVDPKKDLISEMLGNEFINPFFLHHHQEQNERVPVTDFIIGAPVSLPPIIRASTPEPNMDSLIITDSSNKPKTDIKIDDIKTEDVSSSTFSTPLHTLTTKLKQNKIDENNSASSPFYSFESNLSYTNDPMEGDASPKRDLWDSAYVSIDDNNSSPDSNNNDNNSTKVYPSELNYMGPAEREIWKSCSELIDTKVQEEVKPKWDIKRPIFTPIIEESDRSISTCLKDIKYDDGPMAVTVAFAELNNLYRNFFPSEENNMLAQKNQELEYIHHEESVNSASALSDVKRHAESQEGKISEVQANATESFSVSQTLHKPLNEKIYKNELLQDTKSNIVLEKKQYWDERIREIQAKASEEDKTQRKRRLSAKHLRHNDSLTKRRGKQIVKNILSKASEPTETRDKQNDIEIVNRRSPISHGSPDHTGTDVKLVEKWKNYWDNKLQSEKEDTQVSCCKSKSPKSKESSLSPQESRYSTSSDDLIETYNEPLQENSKNQPGKQELPEEVFKAFETSPKRFFGTSRKQILNKIDTFLGKPNTADNSSPDLSGVQKCDTGLVSSRISLFHTISNIEESPSRRKSQSMHDISQRRDSERKLASESQNVRTNLTNHSETPLREAVKKPGFKKETTTIVSQESKESDVEQIDSIKEKRSRIVQSVFNKSFDEIIYQKPLNQTTIQEPPLRNTIREYNKYNFKNKPHYKNINVLRNSSVSKSEMDIFSKVTNKPGEDDLDKYKSCEELPKINVKSFINLYERASSSAEKKPVRKLSRTNSLGTQRFITNSSSTGAVNKIKSTSYVTKLDKTTSETDESMTDLTHTPLTRWGRDLESMSSGSYEPRSLDSVDFDITTTKDLEKQTIYVSLSDIELEIIENIDDPVEKVKKEGVIKTTPFQPKEAPTLEVNSIDYRSRFKMAKEFFQSLEELREVKKPKKLNECQMLLLSSKSSESSESLEEKESKQRPQKRVKKNIKSHSMPSSEISKIWNELQDKQNDSSNKLVKISEKFNVDDLFYDVTEGRLSRQGSLRGIPHKKAVLEAFRSMENLTDKNISSYEIAVTQLADFAKENKVKNAQTYLSEYPYLPTTDPSKYQSRFDAKATGLISLKELHNQKRRRNSVPDLRLNPTFTVQL